MTTITFGQTIKAYRLKNKLTQEQLALESGLGYRSVQDIEYGRQEPGLLTIFKLSVALGVTPNKLTAQAWKDWNEQGD